MSYPTGVEPVGFFPQISSSRKEYASSKNHFIHCDLLEKCARLWKLPTPRRDANRPVGMPGHDSSKFDCAHCPSAGLT